jgi:hypothetical protein
VITGITALARLATPSCRRVCVAATIRTREGHGEAGADVAGVLEGRDDHAERGGGEHDRGRPEAREERERQRRHQTDSDNDEQLGEGNTGHGQ